MIAFADTRMLESENGWLAQRLVGATVALRSDSVSAIYAATLAGLGIALLPSRIAGVDPALVHLPTVSGLFFDAL